MFLEARHTNTLVDLESVESTDATVDLPEVLRVAKQVVFLFGALQPPD